MCFSRIATHLFFTAEIRFLVKCIHSWLCCMWDSCILLSIPNMDAGCCTVLVFRSQWIVLIRSYSLNNINTRLLYVYCIVAIFGLFCWAFYRAIYACIRVPLLCLARALYPFEADSRHLVASKDCSQVKRRWDIDKTIMVLVRGKYFTSSHLVIAVGLLKQVSLGGPVGYSSSAWASLVGQSSSVCRFMLL